MSIQLTFSNVLVSGLTELISKLGPNVANELEFRLGSYSDSHFNFTSGQNLLQFKNIIENLQKKKYVLDEEASLDVIISGSSGQTDFKNTRVSISPLINVRKYCLNEKISGMEVSSVKYMNKTKLSTHDYTEYNLRGQLSKEESITDEILKGQINSAIENQSIKKLYRYKHRYSFTSLTNPLRFDLTLIKTSTGNTFKKSQVLRKEEKYEVEVEYTGAPLTNKSNVNEILTKDIIAEIYDLLKWSQDSFTISTRTERNVIFDEYVGLVFPTEATHKHAVQDIRNYFASMDVLPLDMDKIVIDADSNYYIKEGYSVTDKADGEHFMLFISDSKDYKGSIYLINNRMEIKHTGLRMENPSLYKSLFDGELVKLKDANAYSYLIFDCLFLAGQDMRDLPLYNIGSDLKNIENVENRYQAVIKAIEQYGVAHLASGTELEIDKKDYLFHQKGSPSILKMAGEVYVPAKYPYHLDGLIFTPYGDKYPKASLTKAVRWERLLKWKPIEQLSIDFLVETVKKGGVEVIKTDYDSHSGHEWKYKEAKLKVMKTVKTKTGFEKQFIDFIPSKYKIPDLHLIRLKVDDDGEIRAKDKNIIYNGAIIEFIYDPKLQIGYQWIPIRFRPDKTANQAPNAWRTADSTWSLIKNPVTESMITGQTEVNLASSSLQYYTQNSEALGKLVTPLRTFNNAVKSLLITEIVDHVRSIKGQTEPVDLLDPSCGRAGDLHKWSKAKIEYVLGVDVDEKNLTNEEDGALVRYSTLKEEGAKYPVKAEFIWGDSSKHLNTGAAGQDAVNKEYLRSILTSRGPSSFDVVSCQFSLHYFMKSQQTLEDFLYNVSLNLRLGGYFTATTLDGKKVYDALKEKESLSGSKKNIRIWEIKRAYNSSEPFAAVGQQINVYNVSIGQEIPEYLVNFDHLTKTAKKFGLEPITTGELPNLTGIQSFENIYDTILSNNPGLTKQTNELIGDEKVYSFMNNYLVFKKVGSPSKAAVLSGVVEESLSVIEPQKEEDKPVIIFKKPIIKKPLTLKR